MGEGGGEGEGRGRGERERGGGNGGLHEVFFGFFFGFLTAKKRMRENSSPLEVEGEKERL